MAILINSMAKGAPGLALPHLSFQLWSCNQVGFDLWGHPPGRHHSNPMSLVELLLVCSALRNADLLPAFPLGLICCYGQASVKSDLHKANWPQVLLAQPLSYHMARVIPRRRVTFLKGGWSLALEWTDPCYFPQSKECFWRHGVGVPLRLCLSWGKRK